MEQKQQEARRRILEAARALFIRDSGYEKTTVRQIAARADVSVGAVYLHFKSKPDILAELVDQFFQGIMDRLTRAVQENHSSKKQLKSFLASLAKLSSDRNIILFSQLLAGLSLRNLDKTAANAIASNLGQAIDILTGIISRGSKDGSFPLTRWEPKVIAVIVMQTFQGLMSFMFTPKELYLKISGGLTADTIVSAAMDLMSAIMDGVGAKGL